MSVMKEKLLTILRDKNTSRVNFRKAAEKLAYILAHETADYLNKKEITIETPLAQISGVSLDTDILLVPILRSGITMLPSFLDCFEHASVGVMGVKRDEQTAKPNLYYENLPAIKNDQKVIILDPMLATGGTLVAVLDILKQKNVKQENIIFVGIVCAPEGIKKVQESFANIKLLIAAHDKKLNQNYFIVPGLGDFGDRYFGTE